jgi:hypothetical protein
MIMKKNILLIMFMVFFVGCETGIRYDKNESIKTPPKHEPQSGLVNRDDIESLLDDEEILDDSYSDEREHVVKEVIEEVEEHLDSFSSGIITDGLDVRQIREGKHEGYIRLVFDVYNDAQAAKDVGHYDAKYHKSKKDISVILHSYRKFSASLPSFPHYSVIEQIHFDQYPDDSGFKFHIKLRENAKVRIFDLKNPARIVFDIKPI